MVFDAYKTNKNFEVEAIQWDGQYKTLQWLISYNLEVKNCIVNTNGSVKFLNIFNSTGSFKVKEGDYIFLVDDEFYCMSQKLFEKLFFKLKYV